MKGIGTTVMVVIVIIVLVIGTTGFVLITSQQHTSTGQNTSSTTSLISTLVGTTTTTTTTNSTTSTQGLQLAESINASTITVGQSLNISISILNTLHAVNDIHPSNDWLFQGVPIALWPTCDFGLPAAVVVLNGSYTLQNLQKVANVTFSYGCMEGVEIEHVIFQSSSDQANITGIYAAGTTSNETLGPFRMALSFTAAGYWNLRGLSEEPNIPILGESQSAPPPANTAFSPGVYTIAAADEWGQAVVMHVVVLPAVTSSSSSSSSSISSSTGTSTLASGAPISISSIETADIAIGGAPRLIGVDSNTSRIYVSDWFSNNLTVIDATTHEVVTTIALPGGVGYGIAVDPKTDMVYIPVVACTNTEAASNSCDLPAASSNPAGIVEVNGDTGEITGELPFGVAGLAINPVTNTLYGTGGAGLLAIDAGTGSMIANISLTAGAPSIAVDQDTNMVYVAACGAANFLVCGSEVFLVNGTSQRLQATVQLGFGTYPRIAVDPNTDVAYVTGDASLVALNGTTGQIIYSTNTSTCATIDGLSVNPATDEVYATSLELNYTLVFDGATGHLVNMYSFTEEPQYPSFNPSTGELYVTLPGSLVIFPDITSTGHVDTSLLGRSENCPLP